MKKLQFLPLLLGAIAFTLLPLSVPVQAQESELEQIQADEPEQTQGSDPGQAQEDSLESNQQSDSQDPKQSLFAQLNLSDEQKEQVESIQALLQAQVQSILTPAQVQQLETIKAAGKNESSLSSLNLTSKQKSQIEDAQQLADQRFLLILNGEQQKKLLKLVQKSPQ